MIRKQLEEGIRRAWRAVLGERTPAEGNLFFVVERQTREEFGDYASNVALVGAKVWGGKPRDLAEALRAAVDLGPGKIDRIEVAGPGFLNFFLHDQWLRETLREIVAQGENFGRYLGPRKGKVQVEFVSANPTGPLTVGHGRNAVLGDSIARLLEWTGWKVVREYYFNDAGRQMRLLAESVRARCGELLGRKVEFPEEGYQGQYIWDIARQLVAEEGEKVWERDWSYFKQRAEAAIFEDIKATLDRLGIRFDVFYNEQTLYDEGKVDEVIAELRRRGYVYEKEGALWFQATALGLEQDRVMVKSTGEPTYRLPDIAYHREKLRRGFDRIINVLGADHAAEAPDVLAGLRALGYDPKPIEVVFYQFVTLTRGGQQVRMSTRRANFVTMDELLDEVGPDVARYFFLLRSASSHIEFDLDLAKEQSEKNPVYYVQYAHARICSILRQPEADRMWSREDLGPLEQLTHPAERTLLKALVAFPEEVEEAAKRREPHRLTRYAQELATEFHNFYTQCRVLDRRNPALSRARLSLVQATRTVLRSTLGLLGVGAPERM